MANTFPKITFITSLIRPQNLARIEESLFRHVSGKVYWNWIVIADGKFIQSPKLLPPSHALVYYRQLPEKSYGFLEKNEALDLLEEDSWVTFLDDDMDVHPNFAPLFIKSLEKNPSAVGMAFAQLMPDGSVRSPKPNESNYVGKMDMCQFIFRRSAIGVHRFLGPYNSDGEFFNRIYLEHRGNIIFSDEVGFNHNNLRTEPWDPKVGHGRAY